MTAILMMLAVALTSAQEPQESRVPKDSVELTVIGCLEGRVLTTDGKRQADVERGPNVGERSFRLAGKREVMDEVKKRNHQLVEVIGIVKRSSLDDKGIKSGRVTISGGSPVAGSGGMPSPVENVAVMDVSSVRVRATSCRAD
jgi:hypothetical protein